MTVSAHTYFGHYKLLAFGLGELQIFCVEAHRQLRRRARLRVVFGNVSSYRPTNQVRFVVRQKHPARLFRRRFNTDVCHSVLVHDIFVTDT